MNWADIGPQVGFPFLHPRCHLERAGIWRLALYDASRYKAGRPVIVNFRDREAARIWSGERSRRLPPWIQAGALRKLRMLNNALQVGELSSPRGNRLEALDGDRVGQFSVRITDQWRLCFRWTERGPADVEIVDYHT